MLLDLVFDLGAMLDAIPVEPGVFHLLRLEGAIGSEAEANARSV